jgi:hypothetical protein
MSLQPFIDMETRSVVPVYTQNSLIVLEEGWRIHGYWAGQHWCIQRKFACIIQAGRSMVIGQDNIGVFDGSLLA